MMQNPVPNAAECSQLWSLQRVNISKMHHHIVGFAFMDATDLIVLNMKA